MEIKKSNKADLENKRWVGFVLGLIVALSIFFVVMEYSSDDDGSDKRVDSLKELVLQDKDMIPAIDQQDLAVKKTEEKPTMEDKLNLKRSETPQKVMPHEVGNMDSNDKKTAAPQLSDVPVITKEVSEVPDPSKVKEEAKKETNKLTDDNSDVQVERYDDKVSKRILSETPTPPGGWSAFMKWLTTNIKYPDAAKRVKKQGIVNVTFIVNKDGTVSDVNVKETKNPEFDLEVLRVVRTMGKWKPGIEKNKPCRSMIEVPVVFQFS